MKGIAHPKNDVPLNAASENESIFEVLERVDPSRRRFLRGVLGVGAVAAVTGIPFGGFATRGAHAAPPPTGGGIGFQQVAKSLPVVDRIAVPSGYSCKVLIAWGDPVGIDADGGPVWAGDATQGEAEQARQFGMHNDGMHYFPFPTRGTSGASSTRGLLCVNHEYTHENILHGPDGLTGGAGVTLQKVRKSQAAHGVSVIEVRKLGADWTVVRPSPYARRITGNTPMTLTGPAAGSPLLQTPADPTGREVLGTLNNCAHGYTPWGTYLTCEENWNGYFGTAAPFSATANEQRYGLSAGGFGYLWHLADARFDLRAGGVPSQEPNRFGYVVEIDPFNPNSKPKKRTALGRFKHESVFIVVGADDAVVAYSGDDEANDYIYKFVCRNKYSRTNRAANLDLLDEGTLYVAKFNAGAGGFTPNAANAGPGEWLKLASTDPADAFLPPGFTSKDEVFVFTRRAADAVGATKMDRPEWIAVHPVTKEVYCTLTNNSGRAVADAANPRENNVYGHIIRWRETNGDPAATTFEWDHFVLAGDAANPAPNRSGDIVDQAGEPQGSSDYGSPDGLWFDSDGRLWIQTDHGGTGTGDYGKIGGNVMLAADPSTGETRRFLTSPPRCEVTGVVNTPDNRTMFCGIQHPGEGSPASNPTQVSAWPYGSDATLGPGSPGAVPSPRPRSAVLVITKDDGGVIGTGNVPATTVLR